MAVDLGGALVGWLTSLFGDQLVQQLRNERILHRAMKLAIDNVVTQTNSSSRDLLRSELQQCFSTPPRLALDAFTSVSDGLQAAITAQLAQLDQMRHRDTGEPFYQAVLVDRSWLVEQVNAAIVAAFRQVVAASGLAGLVHALDTENLLKTFKHAHTDTTHTPIIVRMREAQPRLLGVHRAIHVEGAREDLPTYVPRDTDTAERGVRALISAAAERGGFVLLVGSSSVGKTRCAYEAITSLLPDWQLVHPVAGSDQIARLAADPVAQTVVWLDDL
ncbi:MAG TPA: hypothetical protein VFQ48_10730, partial [Pseudonocardiaceae bacterium]|nr:hypothetical protein [Pseudonocardiaceae bacterium]